MRRACGRNNARSHYHGYYYDRLTGFQATRTLTKDPATAKIPVILCSGKLQVTDHAWAEKMGAKACVLKPVAKAEIVAIINKLG